MESRHNELIAPVRTRGALRERESEPSAAGATGPVRTRGGIHTRAVALPAPPHRRKPALALDNLVQELRTQVGDLPLTILVHGWGSLRAEAFLTLLTPLLRHDDALWLIALQEPQTAPTPPALAGAVVLDLRRETDQRTYSNLIGDLVFFPGGAAAEVPQITAWQHRARALIIASQGDQDDSLLHAGGAAGLMTYHWAGEATVEEV